MRLNLRWITILALLALCLACAWGSVVLSQDWLEGFDREERTEASRNGRVEEADDDDRVRERGDRDDDADERDNDDDDDDADERDDDDDDAGSRFTGSIPVSPGTDNPERLAEISAAEVEEIALDEEPEAQLEELSLEVEDGYLVYEVELTNGTEMIIDAGNGDILQTKVRD